MTLLPTVTAVAARTLLLDGHGLLDDPARRAGPRAVHAVISRLGFVQIDSIQRVERAHHLILGARLDGYRAKHLDEVAIRRRQLFENWTHDASMIPTIWLHHWKPRFARTAARLLASNWFRERIGADHEKTVTRVYDRVVAEGPLRTSDFLRAHNAPASSWWNWTPEKTALEFLWRTGALSIHSRENFQKVYDLTERVFPVEHARQAPTEEEHIDWACRSALERLGVATASELAGFWNAVSIAHAMRWCRTEHAARRITEVQVGSLVESTSRKAWALCDWEIRVKKAPDAPDRMRLLAPFDPIIRARKRALRLFGFDYTFEAFVPEKKRKHGYYVLPILEGDRLVGRLDPRYEREKNELVVERVWWEKGIRFTRTRQRKLDAALEILAEQIGATRVRHIIG